MPNWREDKTWGISYSIVGKRPEKEDYYFEKGAGFNEKLDYLHGRKYALQVQDDGKPGLAYYRKIIKQLEQIPTFNKKTKGILIVGCGFGWIIEELLRAGYKNVWGTDISDSIFSRIKDPAIGVPAHVRRRVFNLDIMESDARSVFTKARAGIENGLWTWVITELVVESIYNPESPDYFTDFLAALNGLRSSKTGGVAHVLAAQLSADHESSFDKRLGMTSMTLEEWAKLAHSHWWIDIKTGTLIRGG